MSARSTRLLLTLMVLSCSSESQPDTTTSQTDAGLSAPAFELPMGARPDHRTEIRKTQTLREAIDYARPFMSRAESLSHSELRPIGGTLLLALWAPGRLTWSELQTIPASDPPTDGELRDEDFGNRLCASGPLVQEPWVGVQAIPAAIVRRKSGYFRVVLTQPTQGLEVGAEFAFCGIYTGGGWEPSISARVDSVVGLAKPRM